MKFDLILDGLWYVFIISNSFILNMEWKQLITVWLSELI